MKINKSALTLVSFILLFCISCDSKKEQLIPPVPCACIIDTLIGEWRWAKTYTGFMGTIVDNEFESIVKIISQNEDTSVNYESYAADTLFAKSIFTWNTHQWGGIKPNIMLPHFRTEAESWLLRMEGTNGKSSVDTLCFLTDSDDCYMYYYQKVK